MRGQVRLLFNSMANNGVSVKTITRSMEAAQKLKNISVKTLGELLLSQLPTLRFTGTNLRRFHHQDQDPRQRPGDHPELQVR